MTGIQSDDFDSDRKHAQNIQYRGVGKPLEHARLDSWCGTSLDGPLSIYETSGILVVSLS